MAEEHLPSNLERLERALADAGSRGGPSPGLRARALAAAARELAAGRRRAGWSFAGWAAAAALAWLNLSLAATGGGELPNPLPFRPPAWAQTAADLRRALPELTKDQAEAYALLMAGATSLRPCLQAAARPGSASGPP